MSLMGLPANALPLIGECDRRSPLALTGGPVSGERLGQGCNRSKLQIVSPALQRSKPVLNCSDQHLGVVGLVNPSERLRGLSAQPCRGVMVCRRENASEIQFAVQLQSSFNAVG